MILLQTSEISKLGTGEKILIMGTFDGKDILGMYSFKNCTVISQ